MTISRERLLVIAAAVVLVVARTSVFVIWEQAAFDSDQAIVGLMAKHLAEGRAFPLFFYGQNYLLAVEAWMAAPLFWLAGPSVAALKLPLLAVNVAVAVLLVRLIEREMGLRPVLAGLASVFFVLASPGIANQLMTALGVSVEPFLYVLLIWMLRNRPAWQGLVLGFGFLHREFTAYGFLALLLVSAADRSLFTRKRLTGAGLALAAAAAAVAATWWLRPYSSALGPGTSFADVYGAANNLASLAARVCGEPDLIVRGLRQLFGTYLGYLFGLTPVALSDFWVNSRLEEGVAGGWPIFGAACLAGLVRIVWLRVRPAAPGSSPSIAFGAYLFVVGLLTVIAYDVGRCGDLHVLTVRYALLGVLAPVGILAVWLSLEPRRAVRAGIAGLAIAWGCWSLAGHARLWDEYVFRTPPAYRRAVADYLIANRIRYARADYWTAYHVTFLARERVVVDITEGVRRIASYQTRVEAAGERAVLISRQPCEAPGVEVVPRVYWVCGQVP